ncbi:MAG: hypothetical protein ACI91F_000244 [Candidatus Binatia bacterium]|jgi:hypothetical protein
MGNRGAAIPILATLDRSPQPSRPTQQILMLNGQMLYEYSTQRSNRRIDGQSFAIRRAFGPFRRERGATSPSARPFHGQLPVPVITTNRPSGHVLGRAPWPHAATPGASGTGLDRHDSHHAFRFTASLLSRASRLPASSFTGISSPLPKYISSGVCPKKAA